MSEPRVWWDDDGNVVKKLCSRCQGVYGPEEFHKGTRKSQGYLYHYCKACVRERNARRGDEWATLDAMPLPDWDALLGYKWGK